jgi:hypothetical protein
MLSTTWVRPVLGPELYMPFYPHRLHFHAQLFTGCRRCGGAEAALLNLASLAHTLGPTSTPSFTYAHKISSKGTNSQIPGNHVPDGVFINFLGTTQCLHDVSLTICSPSQHLSCLQVAEDAEKPKQRY